MQSLRYRLTYFSFAIALVQMLTGLGMLTGAVIAVEPLCYLRDDDGTVQDLSEMCAMGSEPISAPSTVPSQETSTSTSGTGGAVVVDSCGTTGDEELRYLRGSVSNETGILVTNVVVRYQVIEEDGNARRVGRRSGLRIEEDQLQADSSGRFNGTKNKFRVAESLSDAYTEILGVEWRNADGEAREYRYPTPRVCRYPFF